jgi:hypothetical protein
VELTVSNITQALTIAPQLPDNAAPSFLRARSDCILGSAISKSAAAWLRDTRHTWPQNQALY